VSIAQYLILSWIVSRYLIKNVEYKRAPQLLSLVDGFMVMGFFVVLTDAFWCGFCALKWLPLFPGDILQISSSFFRDLVGCLLFFLFIGNYFKTEVLRMNKKAWFMLLICFVSQGLWFLLAPSPAFTDYTYAFRHGFPLEFLAAAFLFSHFIMRLPLWLIILLVLDNRNRFHKALKEEKP